MLMHATESIIYHQATDHRMSNIIAALWQVMPPIEVEVNVLWTQFRTKLHHKDKK